MATEIWKLQQKLEDSQKSVESRPSPGSDVPTENGHGPNTEEIHNSGNLDNYSPNNPRALGRKVGKSRLLL